MFQYFNSRFETVEGQLGSEGNDPRAGQPAVVTSGAGSSFVHLPLVRKGDDAEERWRTRAMAVQTEGDGTRASAS